jgi:hypothetical protein
MQEIAKQNPDLSFGDLQQTCFQSLAVKNGQSLNFFRNQEDEDIYTIVENVRVVKENPVSEEELETWVNNKQR